MKAAEWPALSDNPAPWAGLVTSLPEEYDYAARIEGDLPTLSGTLYRVGPGLYERGADRKRMVLDGDGMVHAFRFSPGTVRFRNRFVRTPKFLAEEKARRFLYPTFSTHGSGPLHLNFGLRLANQANTSVIGWGGRVLAFDESQPPFELEADSLATLGEARLYPPEPALRFWAHWKLDAHHRLLHCLAIEPGRAPIANVVSFSLDGQLSRRERIPLGRAVYFHDWFVTPSFFGFLLHPAFVSPTALLRVALARETFSEVVTWRPDEGNVLLLWDRRDGSYRTFETEACWMWHAINAFEERGLWIADFIGSETGGGLGSEASPFFQVMRGAGVQPAAEPSNLQRRYEVEPGRGRLSHQVIDASANFELPGVSATRRGLPHHDAYCIRSERGELFARSLCRVNVRTGCTQVFSFAQGEYCSEPVVLDQLDDASEGRFVATEVYDGRSRRSYLALFDQTRFQDGPLCRIHLEHHVPLSFHGYWSRGTQPDSAGLRDGCPAESRVTR